MGGDQSSSIQRFREAHGRNCFDRRQSLGAIHLFSVAKALHCAAAIMNQFEARNLMILGEPLQIKIAVAAGEPEVVGTDLIGLAVTVAFRAVAVVPAGEIVVTADVVGLCRGHAFEFGRPIRSRRPARPTVNRSALALVAPILIGSAS